MDTGDWTVDIDGKYVLLKFDEISEEQGVFSHAINLPPKVAKILGQALIDLAEIVEEEFGEDDYEDEENEI